MLHIAVVEDDPAHQRTLAGYIRDFLAGREPYECRAYDDGADFLASPPAQLDILFLDIMMSRSNGMDVAHAVRARDESAVIVFVTEAVQYALEGYGVHALDFLVKPLHYTSFCSTMQRAMATLRKQAPSMLRIEFDKTSSVVDAHTVTYAETRSKGTLVHAQSGDYPCSEPLRALEERLAPLGFARCHQAYLVNTAFVESVRKDEVLVAGTWLPLSRRRREEFVQALTREVGSTV